MKKLVLSLAVLFSVAMVSCGDKKAEAVDSETAVVESAEVTEDTTQAADTTVAETPAPATDSAEAAK